MLTFGQFVTELYDEPDDSTFTDNGTTYDLNGVLSATLGMPVHEIPVSDLTWIFNWDNPNADRKRIDQADLNAPILVSKQNVVLDGLHRLAKAAESKFPTIKGIYVSDELLNRYRIS